MTNAVEAALKILAKELADSAEALHKGKGRSPNPMPYELFALSFGTQEFPTLRCCRFTKSMPIWTTLKGVRSTPVNSQGRSKLPWTWVGP